LKVLSSQKKEVGATVVPIQPAPLCTHSLMFLGQFRGPRLFKIQKASLSVWGDCFDPPLFWLDIDNPLNLSADGFKKF
jgi:hypothetical protein